MSAAENEEDPQGKVVRKPVNFKGTALLLLTFQTLGIIYSDLGTSPLYVLNGIWPASGPVPSKEDVIGGISAIIWSLTLIPLLKYVIVSLFFGTHEGEGGTFALYQGIYPREAVDFDSDRTLTGDSGLKTLGPSTASKWRSRFRWPLLIWALLGTSLTLADGVFTPAVSVTSAVGGIAVVKPSVINNIEIIAIAFLLVLFLSQRFGTASLAFMFSPVALVWFLLLMGTGIYNITTFPGIFRAFDPSRAVMLFVRTKKYDLLAGVLLAVTGSEAMFANLGQFNALSIRLSFTTFVYPALVLAYLGQGARLIVEGDAVLENIFYRTIPGKSDGALFWIVFIFALLATLIASQAMITAVFSLTQQLINMKGLPPLKMIYTSETVQGQIYIPAVNWLLMIATIAVVGAFKDLAKLTNAYGFAVATVMFVTTVLLTIQMISVKQWPGVVALGFFIVWGFVDGLFWGAALKKIPEGAWVPLMIGLILLSIMLLWTWGKSLEDAFDSANRTNLRRFIAPYLIAPDQTRRLPTSHSSLAVASGEEIIDDGEETIDNAEQVQGLVYVAHDKEGRHELKELQRTPSCAIFHKITSGKGVPHSFVGFIRQWPAVPRIVVFLSICVVPTARIPLEDRYVVTKVRTIDGFYGVTYYVGFRDDYDVQVKHIMEQICLIETRTGGHEPERLRRKLAEIREFSEVATHVAPHYHVISRRWTKGGALAPAINWLRKTSIEGLYRRMATMFPETANWMTSADEIIHVGINAVI